MGFLFFPRRDKVAWFLLGPPLLFDVQIFLLHAFCKPCVPKLNAHIQLDDKELVCACDVGPGTDKDLFRKIGAHEQKT